MSSSRQRRDHDCVRGPCAHASAWIPVKKFCFFCPPRSHTEASRICMIDFKCRNSRHCEEIMSHKTGTLFPRQSELQRNDSSEPLRCLRMGGGQKKQSLVARYRRWWWAFVHFRPVFSGWRCVLCATAGQTCHENASRIPPSVRRKLRISRSSRKGSQAAASSLGWQSIGNEPDVWP